MEYRKLSIEEIEKAMGDSGIFEYPKYLGNGLYQPIPGMICGEKMMEKINDEIKKQINTDKH